MEADKKAARAAKKVEIKQRKKLIREELDPILKKAEAEELGEDITFEPEAKTALRKAAFQVAYIKKYYDVMKDEILYFPSVTKCILNYTLTEQAEQYYFEEEDEFPVLYSGALRAVVDKIVGESGKGEEDDDDDEDYMAALALDVDVDDDDDDDEDDEEDSDKNTNIATPLEEDEAQRASEQEFQTNFEFDVTAFADSAPNEGGAASTEGLSPDDRRSKIQAELDEILTKASEQLADNNNPLKPKLVKAIQKTAPVVAYCKRVYDAETDRTIDFPSVARTILDGSLFENTKKKKLKEDQYTVLCSIAEELEARDNPDADYEIWDVMAEELSALDSLPSNDEEP